MRAKFTDFKGDALAVERLSIKRTVVVLFSQTSVFDTLIQLNLC